MSFSRKPLVAALMLSLAAMTAQAQDTSSSIRGQITAPNGEPTQANIQIIHVPSGRVSEIKTNAQGRFTAKGLRVGGPYKIIVDSDVYADDIEDNVFLVLGKAFKLNTQLQEQQAVEEVEVVGTAVAMERNSGGSSVFGLQTIETAPNIDRDISSYLRLNPMVNLDTDNNIYIAGNNNKFNSFTVDGLAQNDDFGLNGSGFPTLRSPVSIEALEQISVELSPFNVRANGFSGGLINAVIKSGTNEFHGSTFREKLSDSWSGGKNEKGKDLKIDFDEDIWGATLGGPIIKDKLFFFASYEAWENPKTNDFGPIGSDKNLNSNANLDEYNRVVTAAQEIYGITPLGYDGTISNEDEKVLVKLDWNINDDHRADFTYQNTEGTETRYTSNENQLRDVTHWFDETQSMKNYSLGLYSDWTDALSTELRVSQKSTERTPVLKSRDFGHIAISTHKGGSNVIELGADRFRHANHLTTDTLALEFLAYYELGNHSLMAGTSYSELDVFNLFVQSSLGYWQFQGDGTHTGVELFTGLTDEGQAIDRVASDFFYSNATSNNANDGAASFQVGNYALYLQDTFSITQAFELTYGVRYEWISNSDRPALNSTFTQKYGFDNTATLDGLDIWLPRVGFEWQAHDDVTVNGGVGRYTGGRPNVWVSNNYSNDGVTIVSTSDENLVNPTLTTVDAVYRQQVADQAGAASGNTNVLDPNFQLPSDWRASLGVELALPLDMTLNASLQQVWKENSQNWVNLETTENAPIRTLSDGRKVFQTNRDGDLMLTNADDNGKSTIISTSLSKFWDNGFFASASYTHQDVTEGSAGGSSRAISGYQKAPSVQLGVPEIGRSDYEITHRFVFNMGYNVEYFDGYASHFNVFYERRSGEPFSYTMDQADGADDVLEHADRSNYLPYIPNGAGDTRVVANADEVWNDLVALGLDRYAGGFVEKNSGSDPWITNLDFAFQQEIPNPWIKNHKGVLSLTMENVLSFLDDKGIWDNDLGLQRTRGNPTAAVIQHSVLEDGRYNYTMNTDAANTPKAGITSAWRMKLGLRYAF